MKRFTLLPYFLFLFLFFGKPLFSQEVDKTDLRLGINLRGGVNELRGNGVDISQNYVQRLSYEEYPMPQLGRSAKVHLFVSLVWKDFSQKETWGISFGPAFNAQQYLISTHAGNFLQSFQRRRAWGHISFPLLISRQLALGAGGARLEIAFGPEFSLYNDRVSGYFTRQGNEYLSEVNLRENNLVPDLSFILLWKSQLVRTQDLSLGFGVNMGLKPVMTHRINFFRNDDPDFDLTNSNSWNPSDDDWIYTLEKEILPINYYFILQFDLAVARKS